MDVRPPADDNPAMQHRRLAGAAAMLADPSRAAMVLALMDGRCRSAKKLALDAGVTPQTASAHLKKLVAADMLLSEVRGRSKYFSLAGGEVAPAAREMRFARCCYDHLAGQLGVSITERLLRPGNTVLRDLGIDLAALESLRRPLYRCCTDWTERRPHIAGALGAALLRHYKAERWLVPVDDSRKLVVTPRGRETFVRVVGIEHVVFSA
jgi:DNA-binding transcriptional ArsR family regulator